MNVGPLSGTPEVNTSQSLSGITASDNDSKIGNFGNRTVTISEKSVVNWTDLPASAINGKPLSQRQVAIPNKL